MQSTHVPLLPLQILCTFTKKDSTLPFAVHIHPFYDDKNHQECDGKHNARQESPSPFLHLSHSSCGSLGWLAMNHLPHFLQCLHSIGFGISAFFFFSAIPYSFGGGIRSRTETFGIKTHYTAIMLYPYILRPLPPADTYQHHIGLRPIKQPCLFSLSLATLF